MPSQIIWTLTDYVHFSNFLFLLKSLNPRSNIHSKYFSNTKYISQIFCPIVKVMVSSSSSMVILLDAFFKLSFATAISSTNESLCQSDSSAPLTHSLNSTPAQSYTSQLLETLGLGRPWWQCRLRSQTLAELFSQVTGSDPAAAEIHYLLLLIEFPLLAY